MLMTKELYQEYLAGPHWKVVRETFLHGVKRCEGCGMSRARAKEIYGQDLHCHHLSYANLYGERWGDLEALCRRCHDYEHLGWSTFPPDERPDYEPDSALVAPLRHDVLCWPEMVVSTIDARQAVGLLMNVFSLDQIIAALKELAA